MLLSLSKKGIVTMVLQALSGGLKVPLHYVTEQTLGREIWRDGYLSFNSRVYEFALSVFFGALSLFVSPLWFAGDLLGALVEGDAPFDDRVQLPSTPRMGSQTTYFGPSLSTYQNTSDPNYCQHSDWGKQKEKMRAERKRTFAPASELHTDNDFDTICNSPNYREGNKVRIAIEMADVYLGTSFSDLTHYVSVIDRLRSRGLVPVVSLQHFEPLLGIDRSAETANLFDEFTALATDALRGSVLQENILSYNTEVKGVDILTDVGFNRICRDIQDMGANTLRFSVEMADIYPEGVQSGPSETAMQKYMNVAQKLRDRGIIPMVTLHHFVTPLDENGLPIFESESSIEKFAEYAGFIYEHMKEHVDVFYTFNEANVNANMNYILGEFPSGEMGNIFKSARVCQNMYKAHLAAYNRIHSLDTNNRAVVGMTHQALRFVPSSRWNFIARITCYVMTYFFHESFMQFATNHKNSFDVLGVQFYARPMIGGVIPDSIAHEGQEMEEALQHRYDPEGLFPLLEEIGHELPALPLIVTETGTPRDDLKNDYYRKSLAAFSRAQQNSDKVIGYMPWSIRNNFEWAHGASPDCNFGIAHIPAAMTTLRNFFRPLTHSPQNTVI